MELTPELIKLIQIHAAHNASKFGGTANIGAVMGKLLSVDSSLKANLKILQPQIMGVVSEVNSWGVEKQASFIEEHAPELLEKKVHEERDIYAPLRIQEGQKIVTGFPPEPSKYPHIGHAKAILLNYGLAQRYKGSFVLRFDDTNPELAKKEYYEIHQENYQWLGVQWDSLAYASDYMKDFIGFAQQLLSNGNAFICTCVGEVIKDNRFKGIGCACRDADSAVQSDRWKKMQTAEAGTMIVRLKTDPAHQNTTMRDPTIMRIVDTPHVRTGTQYRIWPTYDFETCLMDGIQKITHRIRTKEFEMRKELHHHIQKLCGFPETVYFDIARFNMTGVESSGRIIRDMIEKGQFCGWDDPRLTTIMALRRRGFHPEAIKNFVISTGMTKNEATLTWDDLIVHNKRYFEEHANRYFFVESPVKITIQNAPLLDVELHLHPTHRKGGRHLKSTTEFYLDNNDVKALDSTHIHRLMDGVNFTKEGAQYTFHSTDYKEFKTKPGGRIMHWLPADETQIIPVEIRMHDGTTKKGVAEKSVMNAKVGEIIQFERFGFCRLDSVDNGILSFWFSHN